MESLATAKKPEGDVPRSQALVRLADTVSPFARLGGPDSPLAQAVHGGAPVGKTVAEPGAAKVDGDERKEQAVAANVGTTIETDELCISMQHILGNGGLRDKPTWIRAIETIGEIGGPRLFGVLIRSTRIHCGTSAEPKIDEDIERAIVSAGIEIVKRHGAAAFAEIDPVLMKPEGIANQKKSLARALIIIAIIKAGGPILQEVGEKLLSAAVESAPSNQDAVGADRIHAEAVEALRAIHGLDAK